MFGVCSCQPDAKFDTIQAYAEHLQNSRTKDANGDTEIQIGNQWLKVAPSLGAIWVSDNGKASWKMVYPPSVLT